MNLLKLWLYRQESTIFENEQIIVYQYSLDKRIEFLDNVISTPLLYLGFPIAVAIGLTEGHLSRLFSDYNKYIINPIILGITSLLVWNLFRNIKWYKKDPQNSVKINWIAISSKNQDMFKNKYVKLNDIQINTQLYRFTRIDNAIEARKTDSNKMIFRDLTSKVIASHIILPYRGISIEYGSFKFKFDLLQYDIERTIIPKYLVILIKDGKLDNN